MQMMESNLYEKILQETQKQYDGCVKIYRQIHRQPEIGLLQHKTSSYIRQILSKIDGISIDEAHPDIPTAIIARLDVSGAKGTILIRSQLDALNFKEQSGLEHSSVNHLHHACGHDGHMASLITAAKIAAKYRAQLKKNVIFCFQPGQEGKGGAEKLMKAKPDLLNGVDNCYALHFMNSSPPGEIYLSKGPITAISVRVNILIQGVSVHCMSPNFGIDANFIGCTLVTQLYSLIGLNIAPFEGATFVIYKVDGGQNVAKVSDRFEISGSLRTTSMESFNRMKSAIQSLSQNICTAYRAKKPLISFGNVLYRPVVNDSALTSATKKKIQAMIPSLIIHENGKSFAGQDFCQFSQKRPSCYIAVGAALPDSIDPNTKQSIYPLHSPFHKFDQSVFKYTTKIWAAIMFQQ